MDAFVIMTVWNHIGKKYMIEKLHIATKKLEHPTSTGIRCLRRKGVMTGSTETKISTMMKVRANTPEEQMEIMHAG